MNIKHKKEIITGFVSVLTCLLLTACSSSSDTPKPESGSAPITAEESESDVTKTDPLQEECIAAIQEGLQLRWTVDNTANDNIADLIQTTKTSIKTELDAITPYKSEKFEDKDFKDLFKEYIQATENQLTGIDYMATDGVQYEALYNEQGYDVRSECLNEFVDSYGLSVDEKYQTKFDELLSGERMITVAPNEEVPVTTDHGDITFSASAVKLTNWRELEQESGDFEIAILECSVANKSYDNLNAPGFVDLTECISVCDLENYQKDFWGTAYEYGDFTEAAGGLPAIPIGTKTRVACPVKLANNIKQVHVIIGNKYDLFLNVE